jgi:hypothetical protein
MPHPHHLQPSLPMRPHCIAHPLAPRSALVVSPASLLHCCSVTLPPPPPCPLPSPTPPTHPHHPHLVLPPPLTHTQVIAEHLYREGRFDLADQFVSEAQVADASHLKAPYTALHTVLEQVRGVCPVFGWVGVGDGALVGCVAHSTTPQGALHSPTHSAGAGVWGACGNACVRSGEPGHSASTWPNTVTSHLCKPS